MNSFIPSHRPPTADIIIDEVAFWKDPRLATKVDDVLARRRRRLGTKH